MFPEKYIGSTRAELDHQFGNRATQVKLALDGVWSTDDLPTMVEESRAGFIAGLQRAVDEQFPVYDGLTHEKLTEVIELAGKINWCSKNEFQELMDLLRELTHK